MFLRFGIQRKKAFLRDARQAFEGLVLPANILLYQYRSTPSVVLLCEKPFFVDPMSYLFGQPYDVFKQRLKKGGEAFKPSFRRLMAGHGLDPATFIAYDYRALMKFLAKSDENVATFSRNALSFQWNNVWDSIQKGQSLMSEDQVAKLSEPKFRPSFLIPPYFKYENGSAGNHALSTVLNERILGACWEMRSEWASIYPLVFLAREQLSAPNPEAVLGSVRAHDFPGWCLWVDGFDERNATQAEISALIRLIRSLSAGSKPVVMLAGGYFSMLLSFFGVQSVCHGLGYGEMRSSFVVAGQRTGPAPVRYYVYGLHRFLTIEDAILILRERPDLMCNCPVCRRLVGRDPEKIARYEAEESLAELHFLHNRHDERRFIGASDLQAAINELDLACEMNDELGTITKRIRGPSGVFDKPIINPSYIREWKNALVAAQGEPEQ